MTNSHSLNENFIKTALVIGAILLFATSVQAQQVPTDAYSARQIIQVPPGNRFVTSPAYSRSVMKTISERMISPEDRFNGTLAILRSNNFANVLERIAPQYGVTPIVVLAAIVGEHTFNTGIADFGQGIYMNMIKGWVSFSSNKKSLATLVREPAFQQCHSLPSSYDIWNCFMSVWDAQYRGRGGNSAYGMEMAFFDPYFAGHTFGIGQLNPMRALMTADVVAQVRGRAPISIDNPEAVYTAILDTESNVHHMSASLAAIIRTYRKITGFDISTNIGVVATLHNLGGEVRRAQELKKRNDAHLAKGQPLEWPVENFYGWKMNEKEDVLRQWLQK